MSDKPINWVGPDDVLTVGTASSEAKIITGTNPTIGINTNTDINVSINVIKPEQLNEGDIIIMSFPEGVCQEALPVITQEMKKLFPKNNILFVDSTQDIRILCREPGKTVNELLDETLGGFEDYDTEVAKKEK